MIKIDELFFSFFKERWLKSKEIYYFLNSIPKLIEQDFIKLSSFPKFKPDSGEYFVFPSSNFYWRNDSHEWKKRPNSNYLNESNLNLKIDGKPNLKRRSYRLIDDGEYTLVHYLQIKENKKGLIGNKRERSVEKDIKKNLPDIFNCLYKKPIKFIDFAPDAIQEYSTTKVVVVFESEYSLENLKLLENNIKIKINNTFVNCKVISKSSISFITPPLPFQEATIDLYINGDKVIDGEKNKMMIKFIRSGNVNNVNTRMFTLKDDEIQEKILEHTKNFDNKIEYFIITNKLKIREIYRNKEENFVLEYFKYFFDVSSKIKKIDLKELLYQNDDLGYSIVHYICALNYAKVLTILFENKIKIFIKSKDDLTPYEICAGKWHKATLIKIIEFIDQKDLKSLYFKQQENKIIHLETLKKALNLAIENEKNIVVKDIQVLEILLKQLKFEYTVDSTSGSILNTLNSLNYKLKEEKNSLEYETSQQKYAQLIQKYVRGWINRSKYTGLKNASNKLKKNMKKFIERKKLKNMRNAVVTIQKNFRFWLNVKN